MRKILFFLLAICLMTCSVFAAPPQAFRYQAVVRDIENRVVANRDVRVMVTLIRNFQAAGSMVVYEAEYAVRSNDLGMISLSIGTGNPIQFEAIDWGAGTHHVQLQMNVYNEAGNPTGHVNLGVVELLSVPYALFARYAANAGGGGGGAIELNLEDRVIPFFDAIGDTLANSVMSQIGNNIVIVRPGGTLPTSDYARLHVDGDIGIGEDFYISLARDFAFIIGLHNEVNGINASIVGIANTVTSTTQLDENIHISGHTNQITNSSDVFILGAGNHVMQASNVSIVGSGNRIPNNITDNYMAVLMGNHNEINTPAAIDNILIGRDNVSGRPSVVAMGTGLRPTQQSIFIGQDIYDDGSRLGSTNNIVLGHGIRTTDRDISTLPTLDDDVSHNVLIGNNITNSPVGQAFSANRTIAIGNDIHPHRPSAANAIGGHNSINIGNTISTSSYSSINIGTNITANVTADVQQTIAIGRNITFPTQDNLLRNINHDGTIVIGTNHPDIYPLLALRGGVLPAMDFLPPPFGPGGTLPPTPRPRFVVGGYATWDVDRAQGLGEVASPIPVHFLYIDDFADVHIGRIGAGGGLGDIMDVRIGRPGFTIDNPQPGTTDQVVISPGMSGGNIFARQAVTIWPPSTVSDYNLKTNIAPIRARNLDSGATAPRRAPRSAETTQTTETFFAHALSNINVFSYNLNLNSTHANPREQWGFMAQDVAPHFPHLVQTFDGETIVMMYEGFIPILWTISQDQQTQINELQDEVDTLRNELSEIRELLNQLKNGRE